ncbi:MAG: nucleoside-diphosphate kinase [Clostridia bacterium]|nr:nucleoside-diphosphate kinase [Clostridia bacterium]
MENTLVLIKPDAVQKNIIGKIIKMYEENHLKIENMYMRTLDQDILARHYEEHINRDFYSSLVAFMQESPVVVLNISGEDAVSKVRGINGATNPNKSRPGTIRYIYGESVQRNTVHGSATIEDAKRELSIWF